MISDKATEGAANNAIANGYRTGYTRPAMNAKAGFSVTARDQMKAAQQAAAGIGEGAAKAAGIRAEDQIFNDSQNLAYQQMVGDRLNANYALDTAAQGADFSKRFAGQQNRFGLNQARQQALMRLRMALLSRME
jgi:hypothetical protein